MRNNKIIQRDVKIIKDHILNRVLNRVTFQEQNLQVEDITSFSISKMFSTWFPLNSDIKSFDIKILVEKLVYAQKSY